MSAATAVGRLALADGRSFEVVIGDLLRQPVDAIVNAANGELVHGGGIAAVIARAAGPALEQECARIVSEQGAIPTGGAVVTTAGRLPFRGVVHAVGPRLGEGDEETKLVAALAAAFARAGERGFASLAFPAVSSGIFAVPLDVCARAYVRAARQQLAGPAAAPLRTLRLCLQPGPLVDLVRAELER